MGRTVSQILLEDYSIAIRPGAKGECPSCHTTYFSLKGDDSLGKCFHPPCGYFLTIHHDHDRLAGVSQVLQAVYKDCHQELLRLAGQPQNAYSYLHDERGIHPQVITEAMLGAVPSGYDVLPHFQSVIAEAQAAVAALQGKQRGRPTKQLVQAETRLEKLQEAQQKLVECFAHRAGWLVFVYTDAAHRPVALRIRNPYTHDFRSFKPGMAGVFGRELFTPYRATTHQAANDNLLVVEGEFNALQLQSLTLRYEETTGEPTGYVHACAVGGVSVADVETVRRAAAHPVVCYDHDANDAGLELVKRLQAVMPLEACTTPLTWGRKSDLDSYIRDFDQDHVAGWDGVKAILADRQPYGRIYTGTGKEFFDYPVNGGKMEVFIPRLLGEALIARETYHYAASQLWVYRDGVYRTCGETTIRAEAQALLGNERREDRVNETLRYIEVATRLEEDDTPPDCQYINLHNGRLNWGTGILEPHTSAVFTTVQLPIVYDPTAVCPAFDDYLRTTFDHDAPPAD